MLVSLFRVELNPIADSAFLRRFRIRVHRWAMILTLFEALLLGEYAKYFTSVSVYCEGLSKGFHLICSSLFSESNWIRWPTPRAFEGVEFECIGGR